MPDPAEIIGRYRDRADRRDWEGSGESLSGDVVDEVAQTLERVTGRDHVVEGF